MVPLNRRPPRTIDLYAHMLPDRRRFLRLREEMEKRRARLLRIAHAPEPSAAGKFARVADLPAHLRIEHRVVENDRRPPLHRQHFRDIRARVIVIVTEKMRRLLRLDFRKLDDLLLLRRPRPRALLFHQCLEASGIDGEPPLARHQLGEIEREAIGVVKFESEVAREQLDVPPDQGESRLVRSRILTTTCFCLKKLDPFI